MTEVGAHLVSNGNQLVVLLQSGSARFTASSNLRHNTLTIILTVSVSMFSRCQYKITNKRGKHVVFRTNSPHSMKTGTQV